MTSTRTDIHRPSAPEFDPEGYECFGVFDLHPEWGSVNRVSTVSALVDQGWSFRGAPHGSGQCSHCGAHIRYAALMGHTETRTLLYIGETCLDNRFSLTKGEFQSLRKEAALNAERRAISERREAFLAEHPDLVWASYAYNIGEAGGEQVYVTEASYYDGVEYATREEAEASCTRDDHVSVITKRGTSWESKTRMGDKISTLNDMWWRFTRQGEMSEKAYAYLVKIVGWLSEAEEKRVVREAESAAARAAAKDVPNGRIVVTGEVVSTKWVDNGYGGALKMLVLSDEGWKVWGTVPSSLDVEKGDRVTFTATVEQSGDDALFGFFKRPTKAQKM